MISQLPWESATSRSLHGEAAAWGPAEHLLATVIDLLAGANWQRGGKKTAPKPRPFPRPGLQRQGERRFGTARPIKEMRRLLDKWTKRR